MSKLSIDDAAMSFGGVAVAAITADRSFAGIQARALRNLQKEYREMFSVLPDERTWAGAVASWILLNATCEPKNILDDSFVCQGWLETRTALPDRQRHFPARRQDSGIGRRS